MQMRIVGHLAAHRRIAIGGAPTSIGIRSYDSGEPRHLDRAPGVLRELGTYRGLAFFTYLSSQVSISVITCLFVSAAA
jgi:hypothetical protein